MSKEGGENSQEVWGKKECEQERRKRREKEEIFIVKQKTAYEIHQ